MFGTYLKAQFKRIRQLFPMFMTAFAFLAGCLGVLAVLLLGADAGQEKKQTVKIGMAGSTEGSYLGFGIEAIQSLDSSRFAIELLRTESEEEAREALKRGELSAYLSIPEGYVEALVRGENPQIAYVTTGDGAGIGSMVMRELLNTVSTLITESQSTIYCTQKLLRDRGRQDMVQEVTERLYLRYVDLILGREEIYELELTGVSGGLSFPEYYACAMIIVLLTLWGVAVAPLFTQRDISLCRLLHAKGLTAGKQVLAEYLAYAVLLYGVFLAAALLEGAAAVFYGASASLTEGTAMAVSIEKAAEKVLSPDWIMGMLPVVLLIAAFHLCVWEWIPNPATGAPIQFLGAVGMGYLSGCYYPITFFPEKIQIIAPFLPTGAAMGYGGKLLAGESAWRETAVLGVYVLGCLAAAIFRRKSKAAIRKQPVHDIFMEIQHRIMGRLRGGVLLREIREADLGKIIRKARKADVEGWPRTDPQRFCCPLKWTEGGNRLRKMRKVLLLYGLFCKRLCKRVSFWLLLCAAPVMALGMRNSDTGESGVLHILLCPENPSDALSGETAEQLMTEKSVIQYTMTERVEEAVALVESGKADALWIFPDRLREKLAQFTGGRLWEEGIIRVVEREENAALRLAREKLFGALYPQISFSVYKDVICEESEWKEEEEVWLENYGSVEVEGSLFRPVLLDGEDTIFPDTEQSFLVMPVRGMLALLVLLCGLAGTLYFLQDQEKGVLDAVPLRKRRSCMYLYQLSSAVMGSAAALPALYFSGVFTNWLREIVWMAAYVLLCVGFCSVMQRVCGDMRKLASLVPIIMLLSFVLCPVFFSVRQANPFSYLLPPYYYLKGIYNNNGILMIWVYCAAALGFDMAWERRAGTFPFSFHIM